MKHLSPKDREELSVEEILNSDKPAGADALDEIAAGELKAPPPLDPAVEAERQVERCLFYLASGNGDQEIVEKTKERGYPMTAGFVKEIKDKVEGGTLTEAYAKAKQRFRDSTKIFPFAEKHQRLTRLHEILTDIQERRRHASGFTTNPRVFIDLVRQERSTLKDIQKESANEDVLDNLLAVTSGDYEKQKTSLVGMIKKAVSEKVFTLEDLSS